MNKTNQMNQRNQMGEEKGVSLSSLLAFSHEPGLTGVTYPITLLA